MPQGSSAVRPTNDLYLYLYLSVLHNEEHFLLIYMSKLQDEKLQYTSNAIPTT